MIFERCLEDPHELRRALEDYEAQGDLRKSSLAPALSGAHVEKAEHNMAFSASIKDEYNDWRITGLYYAAYHASLALVCAKGYTCKHHTAAILFLMRHYGGGFSKDDYRLIEELRLEKEDAIFYQDLKEKRQQASYSTGTQFTSSVVEAFRLRTVSFITKCKELLRGEG